MIFSLILSSLNITSSILKCPILKLTKRDSNLSSKTNEGQLFILSTLHIIATTNATLDFF